MTSVAQAPVESKSTDTAATTGSSDLHKRVLLPYAIAIASQLPMLFLYYWNLSKLPHYQPFFIAILATVVIAWMRWPTGHEKPFHRSLAADILMGLGIAAAGMGVLFVEPWFAALAVILFVTSLLAHTLDPETKGSLWPCALPMYVYLALPMGMDMRLITSLQYYSAVYTSRLLDLLGLGHHMDGTVIDVPTLKDYGIEQACSGVQSFFTLLLVATVFIVLSRRVKVPQLGVSILAIMFGAFMLACQVIPGLTDLVSQLLLIGGVGLFLFAFLGFRAAMLILSAVFWAVFMNTIRILSIPLSEYFAGLDLSTGINHDILGYSALALGILMLLSTDQFLLFLFGPVEHAQESGPFGRLLGKIWNGLSETSDEEAARRRRTGRRSITPSGQRMIWITAGIMLLLGLWQLVDVQRSFASAKKRSFFDSNVIVDFSPNDMPDTLGQWKKQEFKTQNRERGSDFGERSDSWEYQLTNGKGLIAMASLDQAFPGWHELTTCYKNTGWKIGMGDRQTMTPETATKPVADDQTDETIEPSEDPLDTTESTGDEGDNSADSEDEWGLVEVDLEKPTGEHGYLVFSMFDSFGSGLDPPRRWGTLNSLFIRASNRLSHRIRASLLRGEAYQVQVIATSYQEFTPAEKLEIRKHFLKVREELRDEFLKKQEVQNGAE